jgi:hypothetical protein
LRVAHALDVLNATRAAPVDRQMRGVT